MSYLFLTEANILNLNEPHGTVDTVDSFVNQFAKQVTTAEGKNFFLKTLHALISKNDDILHLLTDLPDDAPQWAKTAYEDNDLYMFIPSLEFTNKIKHVLAYVQSIETSLKQERQLALEASKELHTLSRIVSLEQAIEKCNNWFIKLSKGDAKRVDTGTLLVMKCSGGFKWFKLESLESYTIESKTLSKWTDVDSSLRDAESILVLKNPENVTVSMVKINKHKEIMSWAGGKSRAIANNTNANTTLPPKPQYLKYFQELLNRFSELTIRYPNLLMPSGYFLDDITNQITTREEYIKKHVKYVVVKTLDKDITIVKIDTKLDPTKFDPMLREVYPKRINSYHSHEVVYELRENNIPICFAGCQGTSSLITLAPIKNEESNAKVALHLSTLLHFCRMEGYEITDRGAGLCDNDYFLDNVTHIEILCKEDALKQWLTLETLETIETLKLVKIKKIQSDQLLEFFDFSLIYDPDLRENIFADYYMLMQDDEVEATCKCYKKRIDTVKAVTGRFSKSDAVLLFATKLLKHKEITGVAPNYADRLIWHNNNFFTENGIESIDGKVESIVDDGTTKWQKITKKQVIDAILGAMSTPLPSAVTTIYLSPKIKLVRAMVVVSKDEGASCYTITLKPIPSVEEQGSYYDAMTPENIYNHRWQDNFKTNKHNVLKGVTLDQEFYRFKDLIHKEKLTLSDAIHEPHFDKTVKMRVSFFVKIDDEYSDINGFIKTRSIPGQDPESSTIFVKALSLQDTILVALRSASAVDKKYYSDLITENFVGLILMTDYEYLRLLNWFEKPNMLFIVKGIVTAVKNNTVVGIPMRYCKSELFRLLNDEIFMGYIASLKKEKIKLDLRFINALLVKDDDRKRLSVDPDGITLLLDNAPFLSATKPKETTASTTTVDLKNIPPKIFTSSAHTNKFENPYFFSTDRNYAGHPDLYPGWKTNHKQQAKLYELIKTALVRNGLSPMTDMYSGLHSGTYFNFGITGADGDFVWRKYDAGGGSGQNWVYIDGTKMKTSDFTATPTASDKYLAPLVKKKKDKESKKP